LRHGRFANVLRSRLPTDRPAWQSTGGFFRPVAPCVFQGVFYDADMTLAELRSRFELQRQASREPVDVPVLVRRERLLRLCKLLDDNGPVLAVAGGCLGCTASQRPGWG
jgi:hypothetical protein